MVVCWAEIGFWTLIQRQFARISQPTALFIERLNVRESNFHCISKPLGSGGMGRTNCGYAVISVELGQREYFRLERLKLYEYRWQKTAARRMVRSSNI